LDHNFRFLSYGDSCLFLPWFSGTVFVFFRIESNKLIIHFKT
jgi:hypothetical protein